MLRKVGFVNSHKENEKRIALLPGDLDYIPLGLRKQLYFEQGYGSELGITDNQYLSKGTCVATRTDILKHCDIICDPKAGDADYLDSLVDGRVIFGWIHPHVDEHLKDTLLKKRFSVYAWEEMFEDGMHVFYKNNELAGEASVNHACQCYGLLPAGKRAAVIGRGNAARGAYRALINAGADVTVYGRRQEQKFRTDIGQYDIVTVAVLWNPDRRDHIIDRIMLHKMKSSALLIDGSGDKNGAVATSCPTTYDKPLFVTEGITHYCVDHSPSVYFRSASTYISEQVKRFAEPLITGRYDDVLESGHIVDNGRLLAPDSCR